MKKLSCLLIALIMICVGIASSLPAYAADEWSGEWDENRNDMSFGAIGIKLTNEASLSSHIYSAEDFPELSGITYVEDWGQTVFKKQTDGYKRAVERYQALINQAISEGASEKVIGGVGLSELKKLFSDKSPEEFAESAALYLAKRDYADFRNYLVIHFSTESRQKAIEARDLLIKRADVENVFPIQMATPDEPDDEPGAEWKYYAKFCESYPGVEELLTDYEELYYHKTDGETDWALIYAVTNVWEPMIAKTKIGNRVFAMEGANYPFDLGYGIYDVKEGKFYTIGGPFNSKLEEIYPEAVSYIENHSSAFKFKEKFCESYPGIEALLTDYEELYYHKTDDETDWALIYAVTNVWEPMIAKTKIGNRVFAMEGANYPFDLGYGIYDVKEGKFYTIGGPFNSKLEEIYPEAVSVIEELQLGTKLGDMDSDGRLTVVDATGVQKYVAEYPGYDKPELSAVGDMNDDSKVDITDATIIQKTVAEL